MAKLWNSKSRPMPQTRTQIWSQIKSLKQANTWRKTQTSTISQTRWTSLKSKRVGIWSVRSLMKLINQPRPLSWSQNTNPSSAIRTGESCSSVSRSGTWNIKWRSSKTSCGCSTKTAARLICTSMTRLRSFISDSSRTPRFWRSRGSSKAVSSKRARLKSERD